MLKKTIINHKLNSIYNDSTEKSIYYRLYEEYSIYGNCLKDTERSIITVEPKGSQLDIYTKHYGYYKLEQIIDKIIFSLLRYGRAFLILNMDKTQMSADRECEQQETNKLFIEEKKGILIKDRFNTYHFWYLLFGKDDPKELVVTKDNIIEFDIHELGYSRHYFNDVVKKLDKYNILKIGDFVLDPPNGYDYSVHSKNNRMMQLKITKEIGWLPLSNDISASYNIYRGIKQRQVQVELLRYVVDKFNNGIELFFHEKDVGKIVTNLRAINYEQLWDDYSKGVITTHQLMEQLY